MASGISFLAGLLTGAAQGVEQGKRIKLAKEENQIRREQIEATKALGFAQLEATKAHQAGMLALQGRQLDLQEKLGMGGLGLDWAKLFSAEEQASLSRNHDFLTAAHANAMREGNMEKAALIQKDMANFEAILGRISADDAAKRAVATHGAISLIDEGTRSRERQDEAFYRKQFADYTGQSEAGQIRAEERGENRKVAEHKRELADQLVGALMRQENDSYSQNAQFSQQAAMQLMAGLFNQKEYADDPAKAAAAGKKLIRELQGDDGTKSQRARAVIDAYMNGIATDDPNAANQAINAVKDMYKAESRSAGGGETGAAPKSSGGKTIKTVDQYWTEHPPDTTSKPQKLSDVDIRRAVSTLSGLQGGKDILMPAYERGLGGGLDPNRNAAASMLSSGDYDDAIRWLASRMESDKTPGNATYRVAKFLEQYGVGRLTPQRASLTRGSGGAASGTFR